VTLNENRPGRNLTEPDKLLRAIRFSHWPETLEVLYRMRPTVSVQAGSVLRGASDTAV